MCKTIMKVVIKEIHQKASLDTCYGMTQQHDHSSDPGIFSMLLLFPK